MERPGVRADVFDALTSQQCNGVVVMTPDLRGGGYGLMAYGRGGEDVDVRHNPCHGRPNLPRAIDLKRLMSASGHERQNSY
jgi:hypothetical protein